MAFLRAGARRPAAHCRGGQCLAARLRRIRRPPRRLHTRRFRCRRPELVDHLGVTSAVFVGHSMGTLVVQRLAASRPDMVAGLVLIGGLRRLPDEVFDDVWSVVQDLTDPISEPFVRQFQSSTLAAPVPDLLRPARRRKPPGARPCLASRVRRHPHHAPRDTISAPTLLLWGDHDALVPRAEQDALLSAIPDARLVVYEGAGHSPNWEQPAASPRHRRLLFRRQAWPTSTPPERAEHNGCHGATPARAVRAGHEEPMVLAPTRWIRPPGHDGGRPTPQPGQRRRPRNPTFPGLPGLSGTLCNRRDLRVRG